MRKIPFCALLFLILGPTLVHGQDIQLNCPQSLRTARSTYDAGRLHEVPQWLTGCLTKAEDAEGFTEAERVEAYHMLTRTYIYLEEPDKADVEMINLLNTDHFYTIDPNTDPIEFKNLWRKFRTDPVYRVGLRFGVNTNHINVLKNYFIFGSSEGQGTYSSIPGFQFGAIFEKDIRFKREDHKLHMKLVLAPELLYTSMKFEYNNSSLLSEPNTGIALQTISQNRLQANILVHYKLENKEADGRRRYQLADKFIPYVGLGPSVAYLMASKFDGNTNVDELVTGPTEDNKDNYKPITLSAIALVGAKLRLGEFYITADIRYQYGIGNVVNGKNRYKNQNVLDYGYVDNDFSLSQTMINIGLVLPHFHPKKLIK